MNKKNQLGEIATVITLGTIIVVGLASLISNVFLKTPQTTSTKAQAALPPCTDCQGPNNTCMWHSEYNGNCGPGTCTTDEKQCPGDRPSTPDKKTDLPPCSTCDGKKCYQQYANTLISISCSTSAPGECHNNDAECGGGKTTLPPCSSCDGKKCYQVRQNTVASQVCSTNAQGECHNNDSECGGSNYVSKCNDYPSEDACRDGDCTFGCKPVTGIEKCWTCKGPNEVTATPTPSANSSGGYSCNTDSKESNKIDIVGRWNPACCASDVDCKGADNVPQPQSCCVPNGYCISGGSCAAVAPTTPGVAPKAKFARVCSGGTTCAWTYCDGVNFKDIDANCCDDTNNPESKCLKCNSDLQCQQTIPTTALGVTKCMDPYHKESTCPRTYNECVGNGTAATVHVECSQSNTSGCMYWFESTTGGRTQNGASNQKTFKDASCKGPALPTVTPANGKEVGCKYFSTADCQQQNPNSSLTGTCLCVPCGKSSANCTVPAQLNPTQKALASKCTKGTTDYALGALMCDPSDKGLFECTSTGFLYKQTCVGGCAADGKSCLAAASRATDTSNICPVNQAGYSCEVHCDDNTKTSLLSKKCGNFWDSCCVTKTTLLTATPAPSTERCPDFGRCVPHCGDTETYLTAKRCDRFWDTCCVPAARITEIPPAPIEMCPDNGFCSFRSCGGTDVLLSGKKCNNQWDVCCMNPTNLTADLAPAIKSDYCPVGAGGRCDRGCTDYEFALSSRNCSDSWDICCVAKTKANDPVIKALMPVIDPTGKNVTIIETPPGEQKPVNVNVVCGEMFGVANAFACQKVAVSYRTVNGKTQTIIPFANSNPSYAYYACWQNSVAGVISGCQKLPLTSP